MSGQLLTRKQLEQLFVYSKDGTLTVIGGGRGRTNGDVIGAGCVKNKYLRAKVAGRAYPVQVIVWVMHNDAMPVGIIDHQDGDKKNNRIGNLRDSTYQQNNRNRARASNNSIGVKGVHWNPPRKKWRCCVYVNGRREYDAHFETLVDAVIEVRRARERIHGEHARHL